MAEPKKKRIRARSVTPASVMKQMKRVAPVATLTEALAWLPGGVEWAMKLLSMLGWDRLSEAQADKLLGAWEAMPQKERERCNIDKLITDHGLDVTEVGGLIMTAAMKHGYQVGQILAAAMQPTLVAASLTNALEDPVERRAWMQAYGQQLAPKSAEININQQFNQQNITAASAVERGLPAFHETLAEADEALKDARPLQLQAGQDDVYTIDLGEEDERQAEEVSDAGNNRRRQDDSAEP